MGKAKVGSSPDAERQGLYVESRVNGQKVNFLIDTGSSNTLISREVFDKIEESRRSCLQSGAKPVFQADGTPLSIFGRATVEVAVGDAGFVTEVKVARLQNEGILGLDLLMQMNAVLDCRKLELFTPWGKMTCKNQHGAPFCGRTVETETQRASVGMELPCRLLQRGSRLMLRVRYWEQQRGERQIVSDKGVRLKLRLGSSRSKTAALIMNKNGKGALLTDESRGIMMVVCRGNLRETSGN